MAFAEPVAAAAVEEGAATGAAGGGGALRTPRPGRSAMAVDRVNRPAARPKPKPKPAAQPAPTTEEKPAEERAPAEELQDDRGPRRRLPNPGGRIREGSWIVLGFLGWVWVALPFIKGGPSAVGQVLAAKFVNRTPGGKS